MKTKFLFFSVLLITCYLSSCGLIEKKGNDPTTPSDPTNPTYYTLTISAGEGGTVNSSVNGKYEAGKQVKIIATANTGWEFNQWSDGNYTASRTLTMDRNYTLKATFTKKSSDPTETNYYIKHPWGSGKPESWEWRQMAKVGSNYEYEGIWGGVGANINTVPDDAGAAWFNLESISGSSSFSIGDGVRFTYNPSYASLTATKTSDGGGDTPTSDNALVRFEKVDAVDLVIKLGIADNSGNIIVYYEFGSGTGTSPYYEIPAGTFIPKAYWLEEGNYAEGWYAYNDGNGGMWTFDFEAGKKYTFYMEEKSVYIDYDGDMKAPAKKQLVAYKK